ncbi:MAG: TonB family protein [Bacteroidales bacterium]|nr:TonB family protein [Bacteroidales bacterium]
MREKWILTLGLLLAVATVASAQFRDSYRSLDDSEAVAAMKEHVSFLSSAALEGRKAGSEGEREAAAYVTDVLASYGLDVISGADGELFGMKQAAGDTLTSRNVLAYIPGYDASLRDHYIVIGARLDNLGTMPLTVDGERREKIFYGANGNASGLAILMELARMLSAHSVLLKRSVVIAAFGSSLETGAGAWYFLNRSFAAADRIDAMIDLDMLGTGSNGFYAYTGSNPDLNRLLETVNATLQPVRPQTVAREPVASDHRIFYDKEIPAVLFTTGMYPEYNSDRDTASILEYDGMERELEYLYNFSLALVNGRKPAFRKEDDASRPGFLTPDVISFYDCDVRPTFFRSSDPAEFLKRWVYVYLRYPQSAVDEGVQGRVLVDFVINEKGKVTDVKVARGVDPRLDAEAVRVISASPDWKPGILHGKKVKAAISLYVEFRLEKRKKR